jgi:hypothetical protein
MGLDQYLIAKVYLWTNRWLESPSFFERLFKRKTDDKFNRDNNISKKIGKMLNSDIGADKVSFELGYWRKANQIHKWFVDNVQKGVDDCGEYYVSDEDIQTLLNHVNKVLRHKDVNDAEMYLPPHSGFFFGTYDIDDDYFEQLEHTKEILENTIKFVKDMKNEDRWVTIYYSSSW